MGGLLGGTQAAPQQSSGNSMADMASNALDREGSSPDDIASMAYKYMTTK